MSDDARTANFATAFLSRWPRHKEKPTVYNCPICEDRGKLISHGGYRLEWSNRVAVYVDGLDVFWRGKAHHLLYDRLGCETQVVLKNHPDAELCWKLLESIAPNEKGGKRGHSNPKRGKGRAMRRAEEIKRAGGVGID